MNHFPSPSPCGSLTFTCFTQPWPPSPLPSLPLAAPKPLNVSPHRSCKFSRGPATLASPKPPCPHPESPSPFTDCGHHYATNHSSSPHQTVPHFSLHCTRPPPTAKPPLSTLTETLNPRGDSP
ncbi:unnamed protein product [Sphenostylis stenocarpa]|uniref:Uncharacterized protein n=1 Tax=Sphenostylis stenocarpa TaxID=92480 RepID=A0AA86W1M8_9FABA|nr:unnamed protein product [Sphenostylis stenocarpa]